MDSVFHYPMDCGPPGSSIHGIFQARVLEWGAIPKTISTQIPGSGSVSAETNQAFTTSSGKEELSSNLSPEGEEGGNGREKGGVVGGGRACWHPRQM